MNINFTIGLGFLEFCCHFVAMVCYIVGGHIAIRDYKSDVQGIVDGFSFPFILLAGVVFTAIGAHL
jgi:hypothetical protein